MILDPMAVIHGKALLTGDGTTAVVRGDLSRPRSVLAHPEVRDLLRPDEPVGVVAAMVLHFFAAGQAREIMGTLAGMVAPGSYLIVSVGCGAPEVGERLVKEYEAGSLRNHAPGDIASFFAGSRLVDPPGITFAADWSPGARISPPALSGVHVLAGVGRLPALAREGDA